MMLLMSKKIFEVVRFKRKISKSGNNYYIAIPIDYIEGGMLQHGKKYLVKIELIDEEEKK